MIVTTEPLELMVATFWSELVYVNGTSVLSVVGAYGTTENEASPNVFDGIENSPYEGVLRLTSNVNAFVLAV